MQTDLTDLIQSCEPFTAWGGQSFVRLPTPSSQGVYILPIRSQAFRHWLHHQFYVRHGTLPPARALHRLLVHLEAEAHEYDPARTSLAVFRRVASEGPRLAPHRILIDLADRQRHFVEITARGWRTTAGPGVLLQTSRSTVSLPTPQPAADPSPLDPLRSSLNLPTRGIWLRSLAWLLAAFRPNGPFPILILQGPTGSGKTFAARILRSLVDPSAAPLTPIPSSVRDLLTVARYNWVLAFDHISALSPQLTDALCRISSGLGITVREAPGPGLEPFQENLRRPVLLTVTDRFVCPPDLAERALFVTLPPLPHTQRLRDDLLLDNFENAWPAIFGALSNALSTALARLPETIPAGRCANALAWAKAASPALDCTEDEMERAFDTPPPPHPIVEAVRALLDHRRHWTGTATELHALLEPLVTAQTAKGVAQQLKANALLLADQGIELKFRRLPGGNRMISLEEEPCDASFPQNAKDASQNHPPSLQTEQNEEVPAA